MIDVYYLHPGQWPVHIGFTTDPKSFKREMKRLKVDSPPEILNKNASATTHTLIKEGGIVFIIAMTPKTKKHSIEAYAALVAHEALHVVQEMERHFCPIAGRFDDESAAYLLQYIVQECLQQVLKAPRSRAVKP